MRNTRKNIRLFILISAIGIPIFILTTCFSSSAELVLKGEIFGYQYDGKLYITFTVENIGQGIAKNSFVIVIITDSKTREELDLIEQAMGDFLPREVKDIDIRLPDHFDWGDDIRTSIKFRWKNK